LERVVLRFEILDAEVIAFHGCQGCRELFDLGAFRGCGFSLALPGFSDYTPMLGYVLMKKRGIAKNLGCAIPH
jgi:hypothetical protein